MITTEIGTFTPKPNGIDHIFVESASATVRGKSKPVHAHFHLWADGNWHIGTEGTDPTDRASLYVGGLDGATQAFKVKLVAVITPAVDQWAKSPEGAAALAQALADHDEECITNREEEIKKHEQAIAAFRAEIAQIRSGQHLSTYNEQFPSYHPKR